MLFRSPFLFRYFLPYQPTPLRAVLTWPLAGFLVAAVGTAVIAMSAVAVENGAAAGEYFIHSLPPASEAWASSG